MTTKQPAAPVVSRDQHLLNGVTAQRDAAMNEAVTLNADLQVALANNLALGETVLQLQARVRELEEQYEPKPATIPPAITP